ncbi:MAG TPA: hypothetical protein VES95_06440 [Dermatophilaceae bacterium]|nr:hypothetical protein [Dermatophilaceae bacterium]
MGAAARRPVLTSSVAIAVVAAGAATVGVPGEASAEAAPFTVSAAAVSQAHEQSTTAVEDAARIASDRRNVNAQRALVQGRATASERAAAAAEAKKRRAAASKAARDQQRKAVIAGARRDPRAAARELLDDFGFADSQWRCLDQLWMGESEWRHTADNPASSAYGIPQALPGRKMASAGSDWRTNPVTQIRWGLRYIEGSYGTPCAALDAWQSRSPHWY